MLRALASILGISVAALGAGCAGVRSPRTVPWWDETIVTPAGQPSRLSESPSTTFVITGEEVRRSGATSIPEILRRVPGLDVRSITASDGELGLRGFAYEISDRVLVMVDGRTVYIDFFGGTAYAMLPISPVDVERIEVVLGPGASVYGNKAMLGTVNVITRSAADAPSPEARLDASAEESGRLGVRYGAIRGPWRLRATALARTLVPYDRAARSPADAGGGTLSASYSPSPATEVLLEAGGMDGEVHMIPASTRIDEFDSTIGYARARARFGLGGPGSPHGQVEVDAVWNGGEITSPAFPNGTGDFRATYHTPYVEAHHQLRTHVGDVPMRVRWGGEVRLNTLDSTITTGEEAAWNVAAFASDEVLLGQWRLTAGLRIDRSTLTRTSFSPRVSVVWSPAEHHQLRAAFNTGYNNAHLLQYYADLPVGGARVIGNRDLRAEHVLYGEVGWAGELSGDLRAFANAFAYRFADWISLDPRRATAAGVPYGNNEPFDAYGAELGLDVSVRRLLTAYTSYSFLAPTHGAVYPYPVQPHAAPRHKVTAGFRLELALGAYLTMDAQYFGESRIARLSESPSPAQLYDETLLRDFVMAHARVGYAFRSGLDLSLAVTNALDDRTLQFPGGERPERRLWATMAWYR